MSSVAFKVWETEYPEDGHTVVCAETKEEAIASLRKAGQFADADEVDASRAPELDWLAGADGSEEGVLRAAMAEARAALEASPPDVERARKALLYAAQD